MEGVRQSSRNVNEHTSDGLHDGDNSVDNACDGEPSAENRQDPHTDLLNSCLHLLSKNNDSEKLAALLLTTKLGGFSQQQYIQLFRAISNQFLLRLMKSPKNPRGQISFSPFWAAAPTGDKVL